MILTTPPKNGLPVVMYDAACKLCSSQALRAGKLGRGRVEVVSVQANIAHFPEISLEEAMREMKMVDRNGQVYGGAETLVRLINYGFPVLGKLLYIYYLPGLRLLADKTYAWVARNRYRLFGQTDAVKAAINDCDDDACAVHYNLPETPRQTSG